MLSPVLLSRSKNVYPYWLRISKITSCGKCFKNTSVTSAVTSSLDAHPLFWPIPPLSSPSLSPVDGPSGQQSLSPDYCGLEKQCRGWEFCLTPLIWVAPRFQNLMSRCPIMELQARQHPLHYTVHWQQSGGKKCRLFYSSGLQKKRDL